MIVSELRLYDFRQFHGENGQPGLSVSFHKGVNALIGENDSGKTAVIDALIINQALVYSHAKSGEAQKRVEKIIRDTIDILQDIHWSKVPQSTQFVAVTVIDEMQKQNEKQTKEIIAAIKGTNTQTSSQYKRKLSSIQGDEICFEQ